MWKRMKLTKTKTKPIRTGGVMAQQEDAVEEW
jgi:hypothetical protein